MMQMQMQMQMQREESASAAAAEDPNNSLSFRLDSPERITAVDRHINIVDQIEGGEDGGDDDDFDFSFIRITDSSPSAAAAADDIFSDGKIRPVYPVFNRDLLKEEEEEEKEEEEEEEEDQTLKSIRAPLRRLFIEEQRDRVSSFSSTSSSASSSLDELDGVPAGTYCVWTPSKKSRSTGSSMSFRWRLRDLVVGRSHSDGKEKFVFIPNAEKGDKGGGGGSWNSKQESSTSASEKGNISSKGKKKLGKSPPASSTEVDLVTAQKRMMQHYGQEAGNKGSGSGSGRRSYLPYKPDLVGFFANVNRHSRSQHHPF